MKFKFITLSLLIFTFSSNVFSEDFYIKGKRDTKITKKDNGTLEYYHDGNMFLKGKDLSSDGYSTLDSISGADNGFILNLIGSNFGAYFSIYIERMNEDYFVTKVISDYSFNKDEDTSIKITCKKNLNLKYKDITVDSLGVLLYSTDDKEFDKYCYSTEWKSD
uniref:Uncharacterized protein n=1 Tax=Photobacterium damsela subsp. piscicida TaxID=38294 RepID=Q5K382_PHODP|nr:hypothetical protein [Photobacterium damselae subsp. piscicida]